MNPQERHELERYWKDRWHKAKFNLEAARANVESVKHDATSGPDGNYAYARAMKTETAALIEYSRILRVYTDVVVHDKVPPRE